MRTKIKEKSLTTAGFEPTTSWLEHHRSTNWATRSGWVTLWSKYFIMLFITHAKTGWLGRSCLDLYYYCKHVKDTLNHQLLKFTPLRLVSYVAVICFGPQGQPCIRQLRPRYERQSKPWCPVSVLGYGSECYDWKQKKPQYFVSVSKSKSL